MLRPFLLIGVGGSGGKTLRIIRHDLQKRLREGGWGENEPFPKAWQFLQIDVASNPDGDDADLPPQLPAADFLGMVSSGLNYGVIDSALSRNLDDARRLDSLGGWRPQPHTVSVSIDRGAGQFRALGRVITLTKLDAIKAAVVQSVNRVTDADVKGEMRRINALLGSGDAGPAAGDPVVIVISSIAGGSGSGAVIDVCDILRTVGKPWLAESVGILYAPDVFDEIPEANRKGVRPNALATLTELMAGYWTRGYGGMSENSSTLFQAKGLQSGAVEQVGPRYPNLVGSKNLNVSYGSQNEIYRGTGKALAAWMTNDQLQASMSSYYLGNWAAAAVSLQDRLGLKLSGMETPFSALGFARLSLGRDIFVDYAAQRLAKEAVERILRHHLTHRERDEDITDHALIERRASEVWLRFLAGSKLDERGPDKNDVLDALRDTSDVRAQAQEWAGTVVGRVIEGAPAEGLHAPSWSQRIDIALRDHGPALSEKLRADRLDRTRAWVDEVQHDLAEHVLRSVASEGGQVTLSLVRKLIVEIGAAAREMPEEQHRMGSYKERAREQIKSELMQVGTDKVAADHDRIMPAVKRAANVLVYQSEAELRSLTGSLLEELIPSLLEPLAQAVEFGLQQLAEDEVQTRSDPLVNSWSTGDDVPSLLRPARNEFLLDDVDQFATTLATQLMASTGQKTPEDARITALTALVVDSDKLDVSGRRKPGSSGGTGDKAPLHQERRWTTRFANVTEGVSAPGKAKFGLQISAAHLLQRARAWVSWPERSIGRYVNESLREHLDNPQLSPSESAQRLQRFAGQLQGTVERAKPLVNIDPKVLMAVHDQPAPVFQLLMGPMPLAEKSKAAQCAREVLLASGGDHNTNNMFADAATHSIEIFSVLSVPYEPVVFSSLMQPIAEEWSQARLDANARQGFWRWRRTRSLPESIPAAPPVRRAMVRGWFTGLALGQIKVGDTLSEDGVEVYVPARGGDGGWVAMPSPLLQPITSSADAIGAVLESLPLALLDVYSTKSTLPLRPYQQLTTLGSSGSSAAVETYEQLHRALALWIRDGALPDGYPHPDHRVGEPSSSPEMRREAVQTRFEGLRQGYIGRFREIRKKADVPSVPRDYELRSDILGALDDLIAALSRETLATEIGAFG